MNRSLGDGTGDLHGGCVKARRAEVHLGIIRETETFLRPAQHVPVQFVIGVLIVQRRNRVASGWEPELEGCLVTGEGMSAVDEGFVIVFGPAGG